MLKLSIVINKYENQQIINKNNSMTKIKQESFLTERKLPEKNIFATYLNIAKNSDRIADFPFDPRYPVDTYWDYDSVGFTTTWFCQERENEVVVIDFYYNNNRSIEFYLDVLRSRGGYKYGTNFLPNYMNPQGQKTTDTRIVKANEVAEKLCFNSFVVCQKYDKYHMLEEGRDFLNDKCKMDSTKCHEGIQALSDCDVTKVSLRRGGHSSFETSAASSFCHMAMNVKTKQERRQEMQMIEEDYSRFEEADSDFNPLEF